MPDAARWKRLLAEVDADRAAMEEHRDEVETDLQQLGRDHARGTRALLAVSLHHYYTALESLFERYARAFEGVPDRGARWHQDLLRQMTLDIKGIRPAVFRGALLSDLRDLLGFRHFFRHAYAAAFDEEKLARTARRLLEIHPRLVDDLDAFEETVRAALDDDT